MIEPVLAIAAALSVQSPFSRVMLGQSDISVGNRFHCIAISFMLGDWLGRSKLVSLNTVQPDCDYKSLSIMARFYLFKLTAYNNVII